MQQIEFARRQKAHKKLSRILTKALRLHPTKPDLWTYAAQFAMEENGDMSEARSYMQRGLRFCKGSEFLWVEYMKLELLYIAKVTARRQILGIGKDSEPQEPIRSPDGPTAAIVNLPELTAGDDSPDQAPLDDTNNTVLSKLINTPALKGAIPMAIFDAAMVQFSDDDKLAQSFFELVEGVNPVPCLREVLVHIVDHMLRAQPSSWRTAVCSIRMPCAGIPVTSAEFPSKLGISIKKLQAASTEMRNCSEYAESIRGWLETILNNDSLDVALRRVILSVLKPLRTAVT